MAYNTYITSSNVDDLPVDVFDQIFADAEQESVVLRYGTQLRQMTMGELKLKVNDALPVVYFTATRGQEQAFPTGTHKQTTTMTWTNKTVYAEELAALVVIPDNVMNDSSFDVMGEIQRLMPSAIAKKVDSAVLFGQQSVDTPTNWPNGLYYGIPAGNKFSLGARGDLYDDFLNVSGTYSLVELNGFDPNLTVAALNLKGQLRGLRQKDGSGNQTGQPIFVQQPIQNGPTQYSLDGQPIVFPKHGGFNTSLAKAITGDFSQIVYSIAQDIKFEKFTTGVITDASGNIQFNLLQQDLTALRVTFRMGWELPATSVAQFLGTSNPYPFAMIT